MLLKRVYLGEVKYDEKEETYFEKILPSNIFLVDYSIKQKMLNLRRGNGGQIFSFSMEEMLNVFVGYELELHQINEDIPIIIQKLEAIIQDNRCYIKVYFKKIVEYLEDVDKSNKRLYINYTDLELAEKLVTAEKQLTPLSEGKELEYVFWHRNHLIKEIIFRYQNSR